MPNLNVKQQQQHCLIVTQKRLQGFCRLSGAHLFIQQQGRVTNLSLMGSTGIGVLVHSSHKGLSGGGGGEEGCAPRPLLFERPMSLLIPG